MSRHHVNQQWSTFSPKRRAQLKALLPLPCMCGCGRVITPDMTSKDWHVGHRVDAGRGGRPTVANTGAILRGCNLRSGGQLGARITNSKRQASQDIREW